MNRIEMIRDRKRAVGPDAYLRVHTSGEFFLWPNKAASANDDGLRAKSLWRLSKQEVESLISIGIVDEVVEDKKPK